MEIPSGSVVDVKRFRVNHYVKWTTTLSTISDIVLQEFVQANPADFDQVRISLQASVQIRAGKHFSFLVEYEGMFDTSPVVPIAKYLFGINSELRVRF